MTRDELITKKFPHSLFGYDIAAVDKYLDEIIQELDRLHAELDGLKRELSGSTAESVIAEADIIEACLRFSGVTRARQVMFAGDRIFIPIYANR